MGKKFCNIYLHNSNLLVQDTDGWRFSRIHNRTVSGTPLHSVVCSTGLYVITVSCIDLGARGKNHRSQRGIQKI